MDRETFDELLRLVEPHILHAKTHLLPVSTFVRLCITVRLLSSGDSVQSTAFHFRVSDSFVRQCFIETCSALFMALFEFVKSPSTE